MKEEKIDQFITLVYATMPQLRTHYVKPHRGSTVKNPPHAVICLFILEKYEKISMGELADRMGVSNQQITRIIGQLEEDNCVRREVNGSNRRQVDVTLLEEGKSRAERYRELTLSMMRRRFSVLTENELDECCKLLTRLLNILEKIEK